MFALVRLRQASIPPSWKERRISNPYVNSDLCVIFPSAGLCSAHTLLLASIKRDDWNRHNSVSLRDLILLN